MLVPLLVNREGREVTDVPARVTPGTQLQTIAVIKDFIKARLFIFSPFQLNLELYKTLVVFGEASQHQKKQPSMGCFIVFRISIFFKCMTAIGIVTVRSLPSYGIALNASTGGAVHLTVFRIELPVGEQVPC